MHMARALPEVRDRRRFLWLAVAGVVLAGAVLRTVAARDDFWLDEVWSLDYALAAGSPWDIFTNIHSDNNHYLVSLWMHALGNRESWFVYRAPSILAGVGTVVLAAVFARRWGTLESLAASLLTSGSYVLVVYASEARGYALAGFFELAALVALDRYLTARGRGAAAAFSLLVPLGFLAHLTFIHFYVGALLWSIVRLVRGAAGWRSALAGLASCHAVPLAFLAALYWIDVRHIVIGGGPPYVITDVLAESLALAVGAPAVEPLVGVGALVALAVAMAGILFLWQSGSDLWVFFVGVIFLAPALLLLPARPEYLNPRYFYVIIVALLVLASYVLGRVDRWDRAGLPAFVGLVALFLLGNAAALYDFLTHGRGQYRAAVEYMAANSPPGVIQVTSDHDFRNPMLLKYYSSFLPAGREFGYHSMSTPPADPPEWLILHSEQPEVRFHRHVADERGNRYSLARVFPYAGLSGFHWALYRPAD
jgi:hypothetical protein